ncbi:MAG: type I-E CRISPR-associated protein Cas6/Cse3/CasE [Anaeromyxobacteraceae bacterium]
MPGNLFLVQMDFQVERLFALGRRRRLPLREADLGYLVHCATRELFGERAPSQFFVANERHGVAEVLAYTDRSEAELAEDSRSATRDALDTVGVPQIRVREMPVSWRTGRALAFEVRACPIVRLSSASARYRKGAEIDAFLAACARTDAPVDREQVYRDWLSVELERRGGVRARSVRVSAFQRERLLRRDHGRERRPHSVERPSVLFQGQLEVTDGAAFDALLRRGVGRHRGFGFGMLLLRPVR